MPGNSREYTLPCSPTRRCLDRFSILEDAEDDDGLVPLWPLLENILRTPVATTSQLVDILDTISCTLRGSSGPAGDYGSLKQFAETHPTFLDRAWPKIVRAAVQLPDYFPEGSIQVLRSGDRLQLPIGAAASLVSHQFLCTLDCPAWRDCFQDFSIWYASEQRHPIAVNMYLTALSTYFESLLDPDELLRTPTSTFGAREGPVFSLSSLGTEEVSTALSGNDKKLGLIRIVSVPAYNTESQGVNFQGPNGAVVVSANKHIGFGQSATQEEIYVGNCPEACPAVLFTPPLADDQVLVVEGAAPMLQITGQRRNVSWKVLDSDARRGGRMLFMDALEIDEASDTDGLPDLDAANIAREIRKAYTAFSSWNHSLRSVISAGLWGCGAFNGDPVIKMILLWIASSLAGRELHILCDSSHGDFPLVFRRFTERVANWWTVRDLENLLERTPRSLRRMETVRWLDEVIDSIGEHN